MMLLRAWEWRMVPTGMPWNHRDLFDRMIAATALQEGLPLVSSAGAFDAVGVVRVWG